jgi:hypothetical protein
MKQLWEILVPTIRNDGRPIRTRYHRVWDKKVRDISGGLTVLKPAEGQWLAPDGTLFKERMIPVRIACTETEIEKIADFSAAYYEQLAMMFYRISDKVVIKDYSHRPKQKKNQPYAHSQRKLAEPS